MASRCNRFSVALLGMLLAGSLAGQETSQPTEAKTPAHTNRLADESSPYLLQHAHNPVNWYPWGEEAFAKARKENKMVFLSVGYSACHWCHVMERESFVDPEIARIMNERFVCIKVDREERPDVDQIYMTAVQLISGNGGWPMSVFLLPDAQPFWGGTYFPARTGDRGGATGFLSILDQIHQAWTNQPDAVRKQSQQLTSVIKANQRIDDEAGEDNARIPLGRKMVDRVAEALADQFDPQFGGFGYSAAEPNRPKFPEPSNLVFLMDRMQRSSVDEQAREQASSMLIATLDGMISGSMLDHLGGGFHRYSVDRSWQIPHFEKMLYDNGQLASVFAKSYQVTKNPEYRQVAEGICDFVIRELTADGGAFYSALDADSEGEEGKFYRWEKEEIESIVQSIEDHADVISLFGFDQSPNFEKEFYAISPRRTLSDAAKSQGKTFPELDQQVSAFRIAAMKQRDQRVRPMTDIKILTAWNGLMIAGLADAGRILERPNYTSAAAAAAEFVLRELRDQDGRLQRSHAAGESKFNAYVDDYAFLASGLFALHRATGDDKWLKRGRKVTDKQLALFWDDADGGFFFTSSDHPALIVRVKDPVDSAIPSGTSVSAENLLFLTQHVDADVYQEKLQRTLQSAAPLFSRAPGAVPRLASVLAEHLDHRQDTE
tara:strand:- start:32674 stop:34656 length:1983 start_codon:yes stop_codon:yes gene_type:complete